MQEHTLEHSELEALLKVSRESGRPIVVDWTNKTIQVLSASKPTFKKDGTRLVLSDGPAFHREILYRVSRRGVKS
jgi:hypothetical protein